MDNNEMIMETANTVATEVAKKTDYKGMICVGFGFLAGVAATAGLRAGAKKLETMVKNKKSKKAAPQVVVAAENVK